MSKVLVIGIEERKVDDGMLRNINYFPITEDGQIEDEPKNMYTGLNLSHVKTGEVYTLVLGKSQAGKDKLLGVFKS